MHSISTNSSYSNVNYKSQIEGTEVFQIQTTWHWTDSIIKVYYRMFCFPLEQRAFCTDFCLMRWREITLKQSPIPNFSTAQIGCEILSPHTEHRLQDFKVFSLKGFSLEEILFLVHLLLPLQSTFINTQLISSPSFHPP